ncbi:MAG: 2-C-methyl-D-erythritol 4-phosphate cytidylyltransferase [Propionibacteriaceae bacterium]|jgi:2-C-methyl-D-erythritol 4-phosphate cytidylyltransferase|nr:2-C-methyl-D-erythritol 4-phosphate cytidylyltransferase [Propionibacteriaceae bacterium]
MTGELALAIVVAAGEGARLGGSIPKPLRELAGRALVRHAVDNLAAGGVGHVVVVRPPQWDAQFRAALADCAVPISYVSGGDARQDSVARGLGSILGDPELDDARFVLVHDAARALTPPAVVERVVAALTAGAVAVVPVLPVYDSLRMVDENGSRVVDRNDFRAVQTPQGFQKDVLVTAHRNLREEGLAVTDDAAAVELLGYTAVTVDGAREAFKITDPFDLAVAEALARGAA